MDYQTEPYFSDVTWSMCQAKHKDKSINILLVSYIILHRKNNNILYGVKLGFDALLHQFCLKYLGALPVLLKCCTDVPMYAAFTSHR